MASLQVFFVVICISCKFAFYYAFMFCMNCFITSYNPKIQNFCLELKNLHDDNTDGGKCLHQENLRAQIWLFVFAFLFIDHTNKYY